MSLYSMLAEAQTQGSKDGDFISPNQQGVLLLHGVIHHSRGTKQSAILVGEIVESKAKIAGAVVQTPGTKVKKVYALSKFDWAINELKTDLVRIMGLDEKKLSPAQVEEIFADVFEGAERKGPKIENSVLRGCLCAFDTSVIDRSAKGKEPLTKVSFGEVSEANGNSEQDINARKAKLK